MAGKKEAKDAQRRSARSEALSAKGEAPLIKVKVFAEAKKAEARKEGGRFFVYVKSKRREGRANDEAIELLANLLNIPKKRIVIIKGARTPNKIVKIIPQTEIVAR
ncbi:MAG: DUF167 domain-containing protein [bacterium]|nr:DUF167 domain-containing protein [bacterium]